MDSLGNKRGESDWLKIVRGGRDQGFFKTSHRCLGLACSQAEVFGSRLGAQPPTMPSADAYEKMFIYKTPMGSKQSQAGKGFIWRYLQKLLPEI